MKFTKLLARLAATFGGTRYCCACERRVGRFLPYRGGLKDRPPAMVALDVIGSDVENFQCPWCAAHDRERHLHLYFSALAIWEKIKDADVLHFAPERMLGRRIAKLRPARYIKADLFPDRAGIVKEDLTKLSFPDRSFDFVIANHVLEHVADDDAALAEIYRVLKVGGIAVLQTPYSEVLQTTSEDPSITGPKERLEAYGQEDHVRLYGRDLFEKIERAGLSSLVCTHQQVLSKYDPATYGVNMREPFICYQRAK